MQNLVMTFLHKFRKSQPLKTKVTVIPVEGYKGDRRISDKVTDGKMNVSFRKKGRTEPELRLRSFREKFMSKSEKNDTNSSASNGVSLQPKGKPEAFKLKRTQSEQSALKPPKSDLQSVLLAGTLGSSVASYSSSQLFRTVVDDVGIVDDDMFRNFDFPFENLIFEGGGNKGMAYVGALKVLEEAGIMKNVKRVAGASVGAITASLVAVGFTSQDLQEFLDEDLRNVLVDHRCGYCSLLPNLLTGFGWNPGKRLLKWFGDQLRERTGDPDITFKELYQLTGRELCIVVTNLSQMSVEYFHPKTTPNTSIRTAVRMSTAMPGVFQSVLYKLNEQADVYVDGGLLCNYPIHAFDGWWLSLDPDDSFFKRLQPLEDYARLFSKSQRFGKWNKKTLGIILYSDTETELMKSMLSARQGSNPPPQPNSKLYRKRRKMKMKQEAAQMEHQYVVNAVGRLMKVLSVSLISKKHTKSVSGKKYGYSIHELHRLHIDFDGVISQSELKKLFDNAVEFTKEDQILLFGDSDCTAAFQELDKDDDGEITFQELMSFVERKGVNLQSRFLGYTRREIKHLSDFVATLQTALAINVKRNYVEDRDIERTIGIDTDYIETNDFNLEKEDKQFLIESGARATRAFLRHFAKKNPEHRRRGSAMLSRNFFESPRFKRRFEFPDGDLRVEPITESPRTDKPRDSKMEPNRSDSGDSMQTIMTVVPASVSDNNNFESSRLLRQRLLKSSTSTENGDDDDIANIDILPGASR